MSITIVGGGNPSGPTFPVQRSVRLRSSASANFSRTFAANPTVRTKFHLHWIVKRGSLGTDQRMFSGYGGASGDSTFIIFNSSNNLFFNVGGSNGALTSNAVFRDPSAWYIFDLAFDSTQATAANRAILWVNGVQQTWASGTVTLNANAEVALANGNNKIGSNWDNTLYFDGYFTEFYFIDGQALTPASFGAYNAYGVWSPAKYSGSYGTNGFYLNFQDNSGATATTIGKDSSGNGNNWTPNNISVTAGVTYDSMLDVPTLTSNTNANYATLNPLITSALISNANLTTSSNGSMSGVCGTMSLLNGKYYFELSPTSIGTSSHYGIIQQSPSAAQLSTSANSESVAYRNDGNIYRNTGSGFVLNQTVASFTTTDLMAAAVDTINLTVQFYKNNTAVGTPVSLTSGVEYTPWIVFGSTACVTSINFGQRPFSYTPPTGFKSLNTFNLPTPTIPNGAAQFAATLYTGNGAAQTISNTVNGVSFQPDWIWAKPRSVANYHAVWDSVRGSNNLLYPNDTLANDAVTNLNMSVNSSGWSINGANSSFNPSGATIVGWQWKANGTPAVTNTSGSIPSTISANTTAGFSIITYTGTGANATVGHGLGVAPKMVIVKSRSVGGTATYSWAVWQASLAGTEYLILNTTAAKATAATVWNSTTPTSSVFSLGTDSIGNGSTVTYVAYCFAEIAGFSKFGSYTGNGSTDGPFIYLGFRPRWVLIKRTNATENWQLYDTSRNTSNVVGEYLLPNTSGAGATITVLDILSNGFKIRVDGTNPGVNASGSTYIYACFAENPFNYSLAR